MSDLGPMRSILGNKIAQMNRNSNLENLGNGRLRVKRTNEGIVNQLNQGNQGNQENQENQGNQENQSCLISGYIYVPPAAKRWYLWYFYFKLKKGILRLLGNCGCLIIYSMKILAGSKLIFLLLMLHYHW